MARAMLGEWAEAEKYLHLAYMIDYDEEISDVLKEIEERLRQRRCAEAYISLGLSMSLLFKAAYDKAKKQEQSSSSRQDAKKQERSSSAKQKATKQGHSSPNRHMQEPRKQEQSSSSRQSRGGFPGSFPGSFQGGFPGVMKNMQVPLSIQESFEALSVISFDMDKPNVKDGWQS
ncbi:hypothetical protein YC2023_076456 [Brassica napus]